MWRRFTPAVAEGGQRNHKKKSRGGENEANHDRMMLAREGGRGEPQPELVGLDRDMRSKLELERTVLDQRAQELQREARKQARQRAFLREERKKARDEKAAIGSDEEMLKHAKKADFFPSDYLSGDGKRLRLNVGGQVFEISKRFLDQDPDSLLAALAADECPVKEGIPYVDRDWWTFRYVLAFLRDGVLPGSRSLVLNLYKEATFWRLGTLQRAIEETHLNLTRTQIQVDVDPASDTYGLLKETTATKKSKFWLNKPNWYVVVWFFSWVIPLVRRWEAKPIEAKKPNKKAPDWWADTDEWQGRRMGPLSLDPEKVVASKDDIKAKLDVMPMLSSTWGYYC